MGMVGHGLGKSENEDPDHAFLNDSIVACVKGECLSRFEGSTNAFYELVQEITLPGQGFNRDKFKHTL